MTIGQRAKSEIPISDRSWSNAQCNPIKDQRIRPQNKLPTIILFILIPIPIKWHFWSKRPSYTILVIATTTRLLHTKLKFLVREMPGLLGLERRDECHVRHRGPRMEYHESQIVMAAIRDFGWSVVSSLLFIYQSENTKDFQNGRRCITEGCRQKAWLTCSSYLFYL